MSAPLAGADLVALVNVQIARVQYQLDYDTLPWMVRRGLIVQLDQWTTAREYILSFVERAQRAETDRKALLDAVELVCDAFGDISPTSPAFARCISDLHATAARATP